MKISLANTASRDSHKDWIKLSRAGQLGFGMDGSVYATSCKSAIKVFERHKSYQTERDVYLRLRECGVLMILGHIVPGLHDYSDSLRVIEMDIVQPPYILDFAKAQLDMPPDLDFPEHVMAERYEHWAGLFDERWPAVLAIMRELEQRYGIYLLDPNPGNIKFAETD